MNQENKKSEFYKGWMIIYPTSDNTPFQTPYWTISNAILTTYLPTYYYKSIEEVRKYIDDFLFPRFNIIGG